MKRLYSSMYGAAIALLVVCKLSAHSILSLKETFKIEFRIGTALNSNQIEENDAAADKEQFNAVTPENIMKAEGIHTLWDKYDFALADKLVALAKKQYEGKWRR